MNHIHVSALVLHLVALVLGLGGATMTDLLFVTCVRSRSVGDTLGVVMETASRVVLTGYVLLIVTGIALVASGTHPSERFWAKMAVVAVIGVNGVAAHRITLPQLSRSLRNSSPHVTRAFLAQLSTVAAISLASWYTALLMGTWKSAPWSLAGWLTGYAVVLLFSVGLSLVLTPHVLRARDPDFDSVFPVLAPAALQAASVWPEHHAAPARDRIMDARRESLQ
jgi:hypothetical protein